MDRRDFLRSTSGLAALAAGCASANVSTAKADVSGLSSDLRSFTFAFPWQAHHAGFADDANRLARRIEAVAGGAIALKLHAGSSARADFTVSLVQSEIALHPAFAYFGGLPGGDALSPTDLEAWLATGGGQELWDDLASGHGFKPLLAGHTGTHPVLWSRAPISKSDDLAGRRVVARGLDAEILRALGAIPVVADETSLEAALSAPDTAAVLWGSLVHASAAGIPQRYPHGLSGALGSAGGALALEIDLDVWDGLTPMQQLAITSAAHSEFRTATADIEATRTAVSQAITGRYGAKIEVPPPEFSAAVSRIAAAIVAHTATHDTTASRIDGRYSSYRHALGKVGRNIV
jgi:TRAP-type mannitol/chloroaromatic compound transport system substrate-binding protein